MSHTGTRVTARPSLAVALLRAWRTWHEHDPLLPIGPDPAVDHDRDRERADLRTAPAPDLNRLHRSTSSA